MPERGYSHRDGSTSVMPQLPSLASRAPIDALRGETPAPLSARRRPLSTLPPIPEFDRMEVMVDALRGNLAELDKGTLSNLTQQLVSLCDVLSGASGTPIKPAPIPRGVLQSPRAPPAAQPASSPSPQPTRSPLGSSNFNMSFAPHLGASKEAHQFPWMQSQQQQLGSLQSPRSFESPRSFAAFEMQRSSAPPGLFGSLFG